MRRGLQRLSRRSDEIAQNSNVRSVSPDAPGVHWQTKTLREVEVHACVVKLRQAKTLRGQHAIQASRIDRPRRAMTPPRAARQLVKLFPIAFVPGRHFMLRGKSFIPFGNTLASPFWMRARPIRFTRSPRASLLQGTTPLYSGLFIYSINRPATNFPCLLFQTRYGKNCFAKQATEDGAGERPHRWPQSRRVPPDEPPGCLHAAGYYTYSYMFTNATSLSQTLVRAQQLFAAYLHCNWTS